MPGLTVKVCKGYCGLAINTDPDYIVSNSLNAAEPKKSYSYCVQDLSNYEFSLPSWSNGTVNGRPLCTPAGTGDQHKYWAPSRTSTSGTDGQSVLGSPVKGYVTTATYDINLKNTTNTSTVTEPELNNICIGLAKENMGFDNITTFVSSTAPTSTNRKVGHCEANIYCDNLSFSNNNPNNNDITWPELNDPDSTKKALLVDYIGTEKIAQLPLSTSSSSPGYYYKPDSANGGTCLGDLSGFDQSLTSSPMLHTNSNRFGEQNSSCTSTGGKKLVLHPNGKYCENGIDISKNGECILSPTTT